MDSPSARRIETAKRLTRRLFTNPDFRESLAAAPSGEHHMLIASTDDPMSYVLDHVDEVGLPLTLIVYAGKSNFTIITISDPGDDFQGLRPGGTDPFDLTPDTTVGMLVACLWERDDARLQIHPRPLRPDEQLDFELV